MTVCPATVMLPLRELELGFAATEKFTSPVPVPIAPEEIQLAFAVTFQEHPLPLVTVKVPLPGSDEKARLDEETEYVQGGTPS